MKPNPNFINFRNGNTTSKNYSLLWCANWIGHILPSKTRFKEKIEGRIYDEETREKT